jgi:type IV secretion system protein VirB2
MKRPLNPLIFSFILFAAFGLFYTNAWASTDGSMPWDNMLQKIGQELTGPVAHWVAIISIGLTGLGYLFTHGTHPAIHKGIGIAFVVSILAGCTQLLTWLGISGAVI